MAGNGHNDARWPESAAAGERRPSPPRSRFLRRALAVFLTVMALGPALAAFVFAVALPAARIARGGGASAPPAARSFDESFWKSRIELSKKEAISLAVDLVDSTATLDIRGVPVRTCRIQKIEASRALRFLKNGNELGDRLSKPLIVRRETATLPKEPIRVEIAPKDTTEAAKAATRPLAPEEVDVYFTLFFDGHLAIAVRQIEEPSTRSGFWRKTWKDAGESIVQAARAVRSLVRSELPQHELRIEVTLTRDDAKAIYRALGPEARLALRL